ncbi:hypothetical protein V8E53_000561 [Lactarius tabidus]
MSYIWSPRSSELPSVEGWNTGKHSILSTKESTVKASNQAYAFDPDQRPGSTSRSAQYQSSGRGGVGNIRATSDCSQRTYISGVPEDFSPTKGRELQSLFHPGKIISTGRGGAGNVRSSSGGTIGARPSESSSKTDAEQAKYERSLIRKHEAARAARMHECVPTKAFGGKRWCRKHRAFVP